MDKNNEAGRKLIYDVETSDELTDVQNEQLTHQRTLNGLLVCFLSWEPQVCVLGNVRADHAANAIRAALARAGIAAPTGQQAEPVAIYQVRDKYIGAWCDVRAQDYELAQPEKRRILYVAPVNAEPAAPTDKIEEIRALLSEAHDFKSTSKAAQDNINAALDLLDGIAAPTAAEEPSDPVVEANRALLLERSRVGINKYGVTLAASGLSRAQLAQHALEEALDLANYLQTVIQADAAMSAAQAQPKDTTKGQA